MKPRLSSLSLAVLLIANSPVGQADESSPRIDKDFGWETQDWPMRGQNTESENRITERFTNGPLPSAVGGGFGQNWRYTNYVGSPFLTGFHPTPGGSPFNPLPYGFVGPAATAAMVSTSTLGPQGVLAAFSEDSVVILGPIGSLSFPPGYQFFNFNDVIDDPNKSWELPCKPYVGTPILVPEGNVTRNGQSYEETLHVIGLSAYCPELVRMKLIMSTCSGAKGCSGANPAVKSARADGVLFHESFQNNAEFHFAPARDHDIVYYASKNKCTFCPTHGPGMLIATNWRTMTDVWTAPLQTGSGLNIPVPKGQPPPPPDERFHATTAVAVKDDLVVVGVEKYDDDDLGTIDHAILAYNTLDGTQRWIYRVDAQVMPDPVITQDLVVFGTANGRAYAINHDVINRSKDGTLRWATKSEARLKYSLYPFSQEFAQRSDTKLYGPALDDIRQFAYFGGSDGKVHQFDVQSGAVKSSPTLLYYWDYSVDYNGASRFRPCPISTPPAVCRGQCLAVECFTQRYSSDVSTLLSYANGAYVCVLPLPTLAWPSNPVVSGFKNSLKLDAGDGIFVDNATDQLINAVKVSDVAPPSSGYPVQATDPILQINYLLDPVLGFYVNTNPYSGVDKYGGSYSPDGLGGVSFGSGYLIATDKGGNIWGIPSIVRGRGGNPGAAPLGPFPPGPPVYNPPVVLGPIEVYPNPYNPNSAVGGTLKFNNLPAGSYVELYTFAYERVRRIKELNYSARWDGKNEAGQIVAPGTYLYKIFLPDDKPPVSGRIALVRK